MKKIIFLDVDGVLNSKSTIPKRKIIEIDKIHVDLLNQIITAHPDVRFVLSSTWRKPSVKIHRNIYELLKENGFIGQFIGETPIFFNRSRGMEIEAWLEDNLSKKELKESKFVILDDDCDMYPVEKYLIRTSFDFGLNSEHVQQILTIFNSK